MITFSNVTKRFGQKVAVNDLSFQVGAGEVLALLGPNGAGKSTSMKMLTGYLPVSDGTVSVCGFEMHEKAGSAQSRIGYLPEGTPLYTEATVIEFLRFAAAARDVPAKKQKQAVSRVVDCCGLEEVQYQLIDTLSKGYRQRTCLAQSIIHDPKVLVLDEPTDGLDPNQKQDIQNMICEMGEDKSILLSTHIMEEAEFMSDRILLLSKGQSVAEGTMDELRQKLCNQHRIILKLADVSSSEALDVFQTIPAVAKVEQEESAASELSLTIWVAEDESGSSSLLPELATLCHEKAWRVIGMKVVEASLKDIFAEATRES
ncbi:ABC transporter ATP-binding protein [Rubellicoccus peritrichatus]|uniref:ATP-binding cassette domain-containing protein n=1 Tax=Rubellicoccus peritrichatus TaxID=3080537 RepID=A0AAQ3LI90_9BACT|nr:ATP-binding cassette domain-containing protein [Puniceicoccus sp. CR14]WOO42574.1 ATP-binding cassette domain-containing protein [Puniceicoccus sp. CR14]